MELLDTVVEEQSQFGFESFAAQPEYVALNRQTVNKTLDGIISEDIQERGFLTILDFACGPGNITELIKEYLVSHNLDGWVIGVDPNLAALSAAQNNNIKLPNNIKVDLVHTNAESLNEAVIGERALNCAFFLNAIHELLDDESRLEAIRTIYKLLEPGGTLVISTTFIREAITEAARLWGSWKLGAQNLLGGERKKNDGAFQQHPVSHYIDLVTSVGFRTQPIEWERITLTSTSLQAIAGYNAFIDEIYSDFVSPSTDEEDPILIKAKRSNALRNSLANLVSRHEAQHPDMPFTLPRNWATITAVKPDN